eukprot:5948156-Amphidinium_carterae.1
MDERESEAEAMRLQNDLWAGDDRPPLRLVEAGAGAAGYPQSPLLPDTPRSIFAVKSAPKGKAKPAAAKAKAKPAARMGGVSFFGGGASGREG